MAHQNFRSHPSYGSRELATNEFKLTSTHQMEKPEVANWFSIFFPSTSHHDRTLCQSKNERLNRCSRSRALQPPFLALVMTIVFINEAEVDGANNIGMYTYANHDVYAFTYVVCGLE